MERQSDPLHHERKIEASSATLFYNALTEALQQPGVHYYYGHRLGGTLPDGNRFAISDCPSQYHQEFNASNAVNEQLSRQQLLESGRAIIDINVWAPDGGHINDCTLFYPADLGSDSLLIQNDQIRQLGDIPTDEPVVYERQKWAGQYKPLRNPFVKPELNAVYELIAPLSK